MFDPKTDRYPYTQQTDKHYLTLKMDRGIVFNESYPYIDTRGSFRFVDFLFRIALRTVVFPAARIRMGLKIEGRKNLKKHRDELDRGVISICNHVHMWDYIGILYAVRPRRPRLLSWAPNVNGENGTLIRHVGGIPIPEGDVGATKVFLKTVRDLLTEGGWLHIYAEGSMWEYYAPIRPFKQGAARFACDCDKPILPFAYSYREPSWFRRRVLRQIACFTLHVGEPIYPDPDLPKKQRQHDLTVRCHEAVCTMAGIKPSQNLYPPVFDRDQRIDYYTDTYGVGYKGSR